MSKNQKERLISVQDINEILNKCCDGLLRRVSGRPSEPCYAAMFVRDFTSRFHERYYSKGIRIGSCFVHQRPIVKFEDGSGRCEAGDILLICRDVKNNQDVLNTVIFQMKMHDVQTPIHTIRETAQFRLYHDWIPFRFAKKAISDYSYDIEPKRPQSNAQFLFVDSITKSFSVALPARKMDTRKQSLADFICNFVNLQSRGLTMSNAVQDRRFGRLINKYVCPSDCHWDKFIQTLINVTVGSAFSVRKAQFVYENRMSALFNEVYADTTSKDVKNQPLIYKCRHGINIIAINKSLSPFPLPKDCLRYGN